VNTAIAITAIIATMVVIVLVTALFLAARDTTRTKHQSTASSDVAQCTVEQCTTTGTLANPGGDWTRDDKGRRYCPAHPAATSCRICGRNKGSNRLICRPCASSEEQP